MGENINGEVRGCVRCGNVFWYSGFGKIICTKCNEEDKRQFHIVKEYIYENTSATLLDVAKETCVSTSRIKSYLEEGRLVIPDTSMVFINCQVCGTSIKCGKVCPECVKTLSNEIKTSLHIDEFSIGERPSTNSASAKMRFLSEKH